MRQRGELKDQAGKQTFFEGGHGVLSIAFASLGMNRWPATVESR
jgi:hypothetical protein